MATTNLQASPRTSVDEPRIKILSHSDLFSWWPVWAVGFLMALLFFNHLAYVTFSRGQFQMHLAVRTLEREKFSRIL